jgi:hypothetical protein
MSDEVLYDQQVIAFLEEIWGDGFPVTRWSR